MEPLLEKISVTSKSSFAIKEDILPCITTPWHFHPEYELTLITESSGKRFVGDHVASFYPGDMIFVGPNLPHFHRNAEEYYQLPRNHLRVRAIVIHFLEDFLGDAFFGSPEMVKIRHLFERAAKGLVVSGATKKCLAEKMEKMLELEGFDKIFLLLEMLHILSKSRDLTELSSPAFQYPVASTDRVRVNRMYEYILGNYKSAIRLEEAAILLNMSTSTYCRYFKKRTGKTFSNLVNELRVGHACRLLMEGELTVTEICYECGFNNFSYFQRQFKKYTKTTPLKYKHKFFNRK
ncbi:AraC family transcriptional regulator [Cyclobacterium xiamenense]|jgi:AraC-like DNA-binding protein|uniref:AraC family transcriptional regulator n=1 Tax=Cyclobacterium xiamenense TaxID=1297121 RepID=UPI0035CFD2F8